MTNDDLLTVEQAQELLHCGKTRVYALGKKGKLAFLKFGRNTRITRESVQQVISESARGVPKEWRTEMRPEKS